MSGIDIEAVRADTPGCNDLIHLNNAGAALPPRPVVEAMVEYLETEAKVGGYETANLRADDVDRVYQAGARLLGCEPTELAYVQSATQGWTSALQAIALQPGDRVLATTAEYVSNAFALTKLRRGGVEVELIPVDDQGQASLDAMDRVLDERVKLVCATHIPTGGGLINPVAEIGAKAKSVGALFLLDATQSTGQLPVDVDEIGCDFLAITGRKFLRGPRGTGLLYVRSGVVEGLDPQVLDGHSARWTDDWDYELEPNARRFETFETSVAAKVGLGVAIEYALDIGLDVIADRIDMLGRQLRQRLSYVPGVELAETATPNSAIVPFSVQGRTSEEVVSWLRVNGVNTSGVLPLPSGFDPDKRNTEPLVRASLHYYNTDDELADAVVALDY